MGPPSTSASRERGRDLGVEKKCIVAVRRIVLLCGCTTHSSFVFCPFFPRTTTPREQRAPQPLALLQDSYRKNDEQNGLRWAFEGMKTQVKKVSGDGLLGIFFDAKFGEGAD